MDCDSMFDAYYYMDPEACRERNDYLAWLDEMEWDKKMQMRYEEECREEERHDHALSQLRLMFDEA